MIERVPQLVGAGVGGVAVALMIGLGYEGRAQMAVLQRPPPVEMPGIADGNPRAGIITRKAGSMPPPPSDTQQPTQPVGASSPSEAAPRAIIRPRSPGRDKIISEPLKSESVEPDDTRTLIGEADLQRLPFSAIGIIVATFASGDRRQGTGFLVDPGIVLTAAHVLRDHKLDWAVELEFLPGCAFARNQAVVVDASRYRVSGRWDPRSIPLTADYGAIFLPDRDRYAGCGVFTIAPIAPSFVERHERLGTKDFMIAGFPGDKPFGSMWVGGDTIAPRGATTMRHRIDTIVGQSGAPLFAAVDDPATQRRLPLAIGIHSRGSSAPGEANQYNEARLVDGGLIEDLNRWAAELLPPPVARKR
jgi:V8-like Glu-specific endopeptidase